MRRAWLIRPWARRYVRNRLNRPDWFWLFIAGVNNSGTTLLKCVLTHHPEMRVMPGEGQRFTGALPKPGDYGVGRLWTKRLDQFRWFAGDVPKIAERVAYDWAGYFSHHGRILVEKSPPNALRTLWLQQHFKPARFLIVTRHPCAVCEGISRRTGCPVEDAAAHWTAANQCLLEDLPQLEHVLVVTYEQLTSNLMDTLGRIERFLGLRSPFDPSLAEHEFDTHNLDAEPGLIRNLNPRSVERLTPEQCAVIQRIARPVMEQLNYVPRVEQSVEW